MEIVVRLLAHCNTPTYSLAASSTTALTTTITPLTTSYTTPHTTPRSTTAPPSPFTSLCPLDRVVHQVVAQNKRRVHSIHTRSPRLVTVTVTVTFAGTLFTAFVAVLVPAREARPVAVVDVSRATLRVLAHELRPKAPSV